jgi:hypothetical protein
MRIFRKRRTRRGKTVEQQAPPGAARKAVRAGPADKEIEDRLAPRVHKLLGLAAEQDRRAADRLDRADGCASGSRRRPVRGVAVADEGVRALGGFDVAFAGQAAEGKQHGVSRYAELIGQLPRARNVMPGTQLASGDERPDLLADLLVQRTPASRLDLQRNLRRGWSANCRVAY